ncbi:MAG: Rnf-Nqr domain containing protein [Candidatus Merdivicinus sp.]|jgi:electron transport complex protein RnfA
MSDFWEMLRDSIAEMTSIAVVAIFVQNILFTRAMGTSASLFIIRKHYNRLLFGLILTGITTISSILVFFADKGIRQTEIFTYSWAPFLYVWIVGLVYILFLLGCSKLPSHYRSQIIPMIHLSAFNGAVFGSLLLSRNDDLLGHIATGLGTGIGFILASYLIALGHERLSSDKIPSAFRGFPITLIYIGILSLAFYGLIGHELSI